MPRETYREPIFNLKAVVEATGVTADALRAWERRYDLPRPDRTEAGHRIYSQRDIDTVRWLVARQEEGLRIGRAVDLWRSLEERGQDPLRKMPLSSQPAGMPTGQGTADLREEWVSACLAFDDRRADQALTRAFALFSPELVVLDIVREGIAEIGRRWYQGEVTVQQEHFASQVAMRRLKALMTGAPPPTRRGRVVIACSPHEEHAVGPFILALLLRRASWDVVYLGTDVPLERMEQTVDATGPDLVVLAAQQLHTAATLLRMAQLLQRKAVCVGFGGGIFNRIPDLRKRVPGHFLGPTLTKAMERTERLIVTSPQPPAAESRSPAYDEALAHYLDHQLAVEAQVCQSLAVEGLPPQTMHQVADAFSGALLAALQFGEIDLLGDYVDWVERRDVQQQTSVQGLRQVLEAYHEAVRDQLDERAAPIASWLRERLGQTAHNLGERE